MKKRILSVFIISVILMLLISVSAFAADTDVGHTETGPEEAETVSDRDFREAAELIREQYPAQFAVVEAYYNTAVDAMRKTGVLTQFSDWCAENSTPIVAAFVMIMIVVYSVFFVVDRIKLRRDSVSSSRMAAAASNNAVLASRQAQQNMEEAQAQQIASFEKLGGEMMNRMDDQMLLLATEQRRYMEACNQQMQENARSVKGVVESNQKLTQYNVRANTALHGALVMIMEEMAIRPDVKARLRENLNAVKSEVTYNAESVDVTDA